MLERHVAHLGGTAGEAAVVHTSRLQQEGALGTTDDEDVGKELDVHVVARIVVEVDVLHLAWHIADIVQAAGGIFQEPHAVGHEHTLTAIAPAAVNGFYLLHTTVHKLLLFVGADVIAVAFVEVAQQALEA